MNNSELDAKLMAAREPVLPADYEEAFPRTVLANLRSATWKKSPARRVWFPRLTWAAATAACVLLAFAVGHWRGRMETGTIPATDSLTSTKLIRETLAMFPNRVRAIVQDERGINLVLSDNDDVPVSPPLYVRICDGEHCSSLVTFSGQEIQIAGQKVTVLADTHGGVILAGQHFMWSDTERVYAAGHLKITAKNLGSITM